MLPDAFMVCLCDRQSVGGHSHVTTIVVGWL